MIVHRRPVRHHLLTLICIGIMVAIVWSPCANGFKRMRDLRERCPKVKAMRNFDLPAMMGEWFVVQYFASSAEAPEYACMKSRFNVAYNAHDDEQITMNFTYIFADDPVKELQRGNLTWLMDVGQPAHWVHTEDIYEGIYNTYVIDSDYKSWALIMHCAEKKKLPRYLSAFLMARNNTLGVNVINFLREKLPRYNIDTSFMFPIDQINCTLFGETDNHRLASIKLVTP